MCFKEFRFADFQLFGLIRFIGHLPYLGKESVIHRRQQRAYNPQALAPAVIKTDHSVDLNGIHWSRLKSPFPGDDHRKELIGINTAQIRPVFPPDILQ